METPAPGDRRPIATRNAGWAKSAAMELARRKVSPNYISCFSAVCALVAGSALVGLAYTPWRIVMDLLLVVAIAGIQGRLVCNLLDGMVAVEGGLGGGKMGEVFNDLPDRIADPLILIGAGFAAGGHDGLVLGFVASIGALLTAYTRVLGKSIGAKAHFAGPMAKQHRMAVLTGACVISLVSVWFHPIRIVFMMALWIIIVGCLFTVLNRLRLIRRDKLTEDQNPSKNQGVA